MERSSRSPIDGTQRRSTMGGTVSQVSTPSRDDRLLRVRASLADLSTTLSDAVEQRRTNNESQLYQLKDLIVKMEKHLSMEVRRRAEADQALTMSFEKRHQELIETLESKWNDRFLHMTANMDLISRHVAAVEHNMEHVSESLSTVSKAVESAGPTSIHAQLSKAMDIEKNERMAQNAALLRQVAEEVHRVQEAIDTERAARTAAVSALRSEVGDVTQRLERDEHQWRCAIAQDIEGMKNALREERSSRVAAEDSLIATMDQVVEKLTDSLRVVTG